MIWEGWTELDGKITAELTDPDSMITTYRTVPENVITATRTEPDGANAAGRVDPGCAVRTNIAGNGRDNLAGAARVTYHWRFERRTCVLDDFRTQQICKAKNDR